MAQQDVRYYLNGLLLDLKMGKMTTVATDGHRFAMNHLDMAASRTPTQVIVPRKGVLELMRLLKNDDSEITTAVGESHVQIRNDAFTFTSKLIDGRFPDYERVLPKGQERSILIPRDTLREALMRVAILSNEQVPRRAPATPPRIAAHYRQQPRTRRSRRNHHRGLHRRRPGYHLQCHLSLKIYLNTITSGNVKLIFTDSNGHMFMQERT